MYDRFQCGDFEYKINDFCRILVSTDEKENLLEIARIKRAYANASNEPYVEIEWYLVPKSLADHCAKSVGFLFLFFDNSRLSDFPVIVYRICGIHPTQSMTKSSCFLDTSIICRYNQSIVASLLCTLTTKRCLIHCATKLNWPAPRLVTTFVAMAFMLIAFNIHNTI